MNNTVLVVGSIALDTVRTPFGKIKEGLGGSATYFSVSASYFAPVKLVGVVGQDFPKEYLKLLRKHNIDTKGLKSQKGKTFRWTGNYDFDLNEVHTINTALNVFEHFKPDLTPDYASSPYIFLANIDPDLQYDVLAQALRPKLVILDTMNFWISGKRKSLIKVLKKIDIFLINESEARQLADESNLVRAARKIITMGPPTVIIKRGEYGSLYFNGSSIFSAPSYPLEKVFDPTGAGDSFAGGFVGYLAKCGSTADRHIRQAIIFGSVMGSFCVEDFSLGRLGRLTYGEILKRYYEIKQQTHFEPVKE
jgi:sugar/nucleoside kinase (ribokinase family)